MDGMPWVLFHVFVFGLTAIALVVFSHKTRGIPIKAVAVRSVKT